MKRIVATFLLLITVGSRAWGAPYEQIIQTQRLLEGRVNALVQLYDPKGFSVVNLELKKEKAALPGSPFYYEDFMVPGEDKLDIDRIDVVVISRLEELPLDARTLIQESLRSFSKKVRIETKQAPPLAEGVKAPVSEMRLTLPESSHRALFLFAVVVVLLGAAGLFVFGGLGRRIGAIASSVGQGLGGVKESLESGGLGGGANATAEQVTAGGSRASGGIASSSWSQLSKESCLSLLSDCYWCRKDGYAAFIWEQLSIPQRMAVVATWPSLEKYVRHFQGSKPTDLGLHGDVNYLTPVLFPHLDNEALTEQVKKNPALLSRLSPLRSESLVLGVEERLTLQGQATQSGQSSLPDLRNVSASVERKLLAFPKVRVTSEAAEAEAINLRELPVEAKEQFITLAWMVQLPRERVSAVLEGFSARELAQAWLGPSALLTYLGECLAPKKRELVESYRKSVAPSRDSEVFFRLHRLAMEAFRQEKERAEGGGDYAKAA